MSVSLGVHGPSLLIACPVAPAGLYVMYTHMIKQRRRSLGKGFLGTKRAEKKRNALNSAARQKGIKSVADGTWATGGSSEKKSK